MLDKPTHMPIREKLLDIILTTSPSQHTYTSVLPLGCSDHYMPYTILSMQRPAQNHRQATIRCYKKFDEESFLSDLTQQKIKRDMCRNIQSNDNRRNDLQERLDQNWEF